MVQLLERGTQGYTGNLRARGTVLPVALRLSQGWQWVYGPAKNAVTLQLAEHTHTSNKMLCKMVSHGT